MDGKVWNLYNIFSMCIVVHPDLNSCFNNSASVHSHTRFWKRVFPKKYSLINEGTNQSYCAFQGPNAWQFIGISNFDSFDFLKLLSVVGLRHGHWTKKCFRSQVWNVDVLNTPICHDIGSKIIGNSQWQPRIVCDFSMTPMTLIFLSIFFLEIQPNKTANFK